MARLYVLSEMPRPQRAEKAANRMLWVIIVVLAGLILAELVIQFALAPNLLVRNVVVRGAMAIAREDIVRVAGLSEKEYYFSISTAECEKRIASIPEVKSVTCSKSFPDTLSITVTERSPLAVALVEDGGRSVPIVFDEEGVVFGRYDGTRDSRLPVLSGLKWESYGAGTRLPEKLVPFLGDLLEVRTTARNVYDFISEVKVEASGKDGLELVFYMLPYDTRIRMGSRVNEGTLTYAIMACDALKKQNLDSSVRELDFRSKDIVLQGGT